jgi:carbonic anhydrase
MCFAAAHAKPNMAPPVSTAGFLNWMEHESHCGGQHQSPINIESNKAILANYPEFIFHNYDLVFPESLENNGHTGTIY